MPLCSSVRSKAAGNASLEFAIAFGLLWTCVAGIFELGYASYIYYRLQIAVGAAGRYGSFADFDAAGVVFTQSIENMVVYGSPSGGVNPVVAGLTTAQVAVLWTSDSAGLPQTVTVKISSYQCPGVFGAMGWSGKPSVTVRYMGVVKP
jgi:Flp pilus assembly protein TadG